MEGRSLRARQSSWGFAPYLRLRARKEENTMEGFELAASSA